MEVFVLYADYGQYEGCSSPEDIVLTQAEADAYVAKNPESNAYSVFDIELSPSLEEKK